MPNNESPAFARDTDHKTTEFRGEIPRYIIDVVDAVVTARGGQSANVFRTTIFAEVMGIWAKGKLHESILVQRVAGGNPLGMDAHGGHP